MTTTTPLTLPVYRVEFASGRDAFQDLCNAMDTQGYELHSWEWPDDGSVTAVFKLKQFNFTINPLPLQPYLPAQPYTPWPPTGPIYTITNEQESQ